MQRNIISIIVFLFFLTGCASLPKEYLRTYSSAFTDYKSTKVGRLFEKEAAKHPGKSGFKLIPYGQDAFTARIAMARLAQKSLDLQYYIWNSDKVGLLLANEILDAADRGVKVRILLDDIEQSGRDNIVATMNTHPNIQIRIFNPFAHRNTHMLDFLGDFDRVNHRMHNKTFIVDNGLVFIGGRNIGDQYFSVAEQTNFRDLDIAAAGPIVRRISTVYDHFWNGEWAVPIDALSKQNYHTEDLKKLHRLIKQKITTLNFPYPLNKDITTLKKDLIQIRKSFTWAKSTYVWDEPGNMQVRPDKQTNTMIQQLEKRVRSVKKSLYIESAYFVPRPVGMAALKRLQKRGAKVRIMTNSLASNDVIPAHAGYAGYRKKLLRAGVELYELRADVGANRITNKQLITHTINTGLHTKAMVFDGKAVFVGSFNLDPRSAAINTEGGLYIESQKIAREVLAYMNEGVKLKNSYRVILDNRGSLAWVTVINGKITVYHSDPEVGEWKRMKAGFIGILPVELQR